MTTGEDSKGDSCQKCLEREQGVVFFGRQRWKDLHLPPLIGPDGNETAASERLGDEFAMMKSSACEVTKVTLKKQ